MSQNDLRKPARSWPSGKTTFHVKFGKVEAYFSEISGLDNENQVIEYRGGDTSAVSARKIPGTVKYNDVTLKRGTFAKDNRFFEWHNKIREKNIDRETVTISLLDETGSAVMTWNLLNAFPKKIQGAELKSDGNEVAVETIELSHEGLTINKR